MSLLPLLSNTYPYVHTYTHIPILHTYTHIHAHTHTCLHLNQQIKGEKSWRKKKKSKLFLNSSTKPYSIHFIITNPTKVNCHLLQMFRLHQSTEHLCLNGPGEARSLLPSRSAHLHRCRLLEESRSAQGPRTPSQSESYSPRQAPLLLWETGLCLQQTRQKAQENISPLKEEAPHPGVIKITSSVST